MLAIEAATLEELEDVVIRTSLVRFFGCAFPCNFPHRVTIFSPLSEHEIEGRLRHIEDIDDELPSESYAASVPSFRQRTHCMQTNEYVEECILEGDDSADDDSTPDIKETLSDQSPQPSPDQMKALQDELARLKMMIADVVSKQELQESKIANQSTSSCFSPTPPPPPMMMEGSTTGFAPPPPPPPMPPMNLIVEDKKPSIFEIIQAQKKKNGGQSSFAAQNQPSRPSMADVLRGLGTVKLKSVARSPGGTPMKGDKPESTPCDAASMIAAALKRKFAQRRKMIADDDEDEDDD
eukprot:m.18170 g.18170  ORF g.18170 m.18170 type:complete len:294 (+) comp4916_c1_seq1:93-974(+)